MYKNEYEVEWPIDIVHVVLHSEDIAKYMFTKKQYIEAKTWIKKWGYHLWESQRGAGIRLEPFSFTIISTVVDKDVHYTSDSLKWYPIIDSVCYAAMLLYRRLKRDNVIA